MRIALFGSGGFVGRAVKQAASGIETVDLAVSCRGVWESSGFAAGAVERWMAGNPEERSRLAGELEGIEVVINAAGSALPAARPTPELFDANAALPGVIAALAAEAGVRRMVHISSAAVQGRMDPLDETSSTAPVTPYGQSKASGEQVLTGGSVPAPQEVVLYRPTSVQASDRQITRQLVSFASSKHLPVARRGERPVPLCLLPNVAAGVVHAATCPEHLRVALQPWEGITTGLLWELFGENPSTLSVPAPAVRLAVAAIIGLGRVMPRAGAVGRRLELLLLGQAQNAAALESTGFVAPVGLDGYSKLAEEVRGL